MAEQPYGFSQKAAQRITNAVSHVERELINGKPRYRRQSPVVQSGDGFWARLLTRDYTSQTYGWQKVRPLENGTWQVDASVTGTTTDKPARETSGFMFVPALERVWIQPRHDYYVFDYDHQIVNGFTNAIILAGATGSCSVKLLTTDTGQDVTATNNFDDLPLGANVMLAKLGASWYILPNTNKTVFVQVTAATRDGGCLWDGKIIVPTSAISPCSGSFADGATCKLLVLDADGGSSATEGKELTVGDRYEAKFMFLSSGNQVYGIRNGGGSSWFCEFELNNDKEPTAATAFSVTVNSWWGGSDPGAMIDVHDTPLVNSLYAHRGQDGDAGIAVFDPKADEGDGRWRILTLRPTVQRECLANLSGTLLHSDANANVGSLVALDGGDAPSISTVENTFDLAGQNGSPCLICENLSDSSWFLKQVKHVTHEIVVDVTYDDTDHTWKKDVLSATYVGTASPTSEDILALTDVDHVSNVDVSGTALRQTKQKIYVAEADTPGSPTTIDSGTTC